MYSISNQRLYKLIYEYEQEIVYEQNVKYSRQNCSFDFYTETQLFLRLNRINPNNYHLIADVELYHDSQVVKDQQCSYKTDKCILYNIRRFEEDNPELYIDFNSKSFEDMFMIFTRYNEDILKFIPESFITEEKCKLSIQLHGKVLKHVPQEFKTPELCELAVRNCGLSLKYVPIELRTIHLSKISVQLCNHCFEDIPDNVWVNEDFCKFVVHVYSYKDAINHVPVHLRIPELCRLIAWQLNM